MKNSGLPARCDPRFLAFLLIRCWSLQTQSLMTSSDKQGTALANYRNRSPKHMAWIRTMEIRVTTRSAIRSILIFPFREGIALRAWVWPGAEDQHGSLD